MTDPADLCASTSRLQVGHASTRAGTELRVCFPQAREVYRQHTVSRVAEMTELLEYNHHNDEYMD